MDQIPPPGLGKVLIAVGPDGIPVDLCVLNVSESANDEGTPESRVEKAFTEKGYALFKLQDFQEFAAWLQTEVLSGRVRLPYHPQQRLQLRWTPSVGQVRGDIK